MSACPHCELEGKRPVEGCCPVHGWMGRVNEDASITSIEIKSASGHFPAGTRVRVERPTGPIALTASYLPTETVTKRLIQDVAEAFIALRDNVFDNSPLLLEAFERADEAIARLLATVEDGS